MGSGRLSHRCPSRCHKCPALNGAIMPGCMGTAALARGPHDMSACTCYAPPGEDERIARLESEVKALKEKVAQLTTAAPKDGRVCSALPG